MENLNKTGKQPLKELASLEDLAAEFDVWKANLTKIEVLVQKIRSRLERYIEQCAEQSLPGLERLEHQQNDLKGLQADLRANERKFETLFDHIPTFSFVIDRNHRRVAYNQASPRKFRKEIGTKTLDLQCVDKPTREFWHHVEEQVINSGCATWYVERVHTESGKTLYYENRIAPIIDADGRVAMLVGIASDITERRQVEEALLAKEKKLREQARALQDANTALEVLLRHGEEKSERLQKSVQISVQMLVLPYLEKLKDTELTTEQKAYVNIAMSHLSEITSQFVSRLSSKSFGLTPRELQVASLVRNGKDSAAIADILCISEDTVSFHRKKIRSKLGLKKKNVNLTTYLSTLAQ
ncbi:MAG: PAS domain S-box protein [Deltaproteobacteria bacterium]|nr:PAS domain S-box protein [Deltaproteobacteria bacterium]